MNGQRPGDGFVIVAACMTAAFIGMITHSFIWPVVATAIVTVGLGILNDLLQPEPAPEDTDETDAHWSAW